MWEFKANPLSFLNTAVLFPQNKYCYLDMIAAVAVAVVAERHLCFEFELRSFAVKNRCVYSLTFAPFFVCLNS